MTTPPETNAAARERCADCGFDADEWNNQDTIRTLARAAPAILRSFLDGPADGLPDPDIANRRANDETWSIGEYVHHIGDVYEMIELGMNLSIAEPGTVVDDPGPPPVGDHRNVELGPALERIEAAAARVGELLGGLRGDDWSAHLVVDGQRRDLVWASRHLVHDWWHHLIDIADVRGRLDDGVAPQAGTVERLAVSNGGVPKLEIDSAEVGRRGLVGDRQGSRRHHGRPWQGLCLWSGDVIDALRAEGHPVPDGGAGENLTIRGLDWGQLRGGAVLEVGGVRCRLSGPAEPCTKIGPNFADGDHRRVDHARHPGWSRWYAQVEQTGAITVGDEVRVS